MMSNKTQAYVDAETQGHDVILSGLFGVWRWTVGGLCKFGGRRGTGHRATGC